MEYVKSIDIVPNANNTSPIQIWVPIPKGSKYSYDVKEVSTDNITFSIGNREDNIFDMLYFQIKTSSPFQINVSFAFNDEFKFPNNETLLNLGLQSELYIDIEQENLKKYVKDIIRDNEDISNSEYIKLIKETLSPILKYSRVPETRVASKVLESLKSDCAGYNSIFCAMLRLRNIPCHLLFGFNTDEDDTYHATVYLYDNGKWIRDDLREHQRYKGVLQPFLPISIGSGIKIETDNTPEFPKPVLHLQHSLVWIEGNPPQKVEKLFKILKND